MALGLRAVAVLPEQPVQFPAPTWQLLTLMSPILECPAPSQRHICRQRGNEKKRDSSHLKVLSNYFWQSKSSFQGWQDFQGQSSCCCSLSCVWFTAPKSGSSQKKPINSNPEDQMPPFGPHIRCFLLSSFQKVSFVSRWAPSEISQTTLSAVPRSLGWPFYLQV